MQWCLNRTVRRVLSWCSLAAVVVLAACGSGDNPTTINVPGDESSIQAAVDAAAPGDTILIAPGTYREQIIVETDDLTIRGFDRNDVVLDGDNELFDGFLVVSDGVAIENLTVQHFRQNGVIFTGQAAYSDAADGEPLERYRISHVTAINNGTYGIYAFAARDGLITDTYASGSPDSGFYVGQCKPCDVVLRNVTAERNSIGYYGTNASGGVFVVESTFRGNRLGLPPNSQDAERLAPQEGTVIAGNLVVDNDNPDAPSIPEGFFGGGIVVGGGSDNEIIRNRVSGHVAVGIGLIPFDGYQSSDNTLIGNVLSDNGTDLVIATNGGPNGNCVEDNEFDSESPVGVSDVIVCGVSADAFEAVDLVTPEAPPPVDYRTVERPGPQPTMPNPEAAPMRVAGAPAVDIDAITVPPLD